MYIYKNKITKLYYSYRDFRNLKNVDVEDPEEAMIFSKFSISFFAENNKYNRILLTQELRKYKLQKLNELHI